MAQDWYADVRKYAPNADEGVVASIVRYCGVALQSQDSSLVAFSDKEELRLVRENFLKRKLGLTDPDSRLDEAIAEVGAQMKADRTKNRVTVYYLLSEHFGKLALFGGAPAAAGVAPAAGVAAAAGGAAAAGLAAASAFGGRNDDEPVAAPRPLAGGAAAASATPYPLASGAAAASAAGKSGLMRWLPWLIAAAIVLALLWFLLGRKPAPAPEIAAPEATTPVAPATSTAAVPAPAPAATALPVSVYFDVGSAALNDEGSKAIAAAAEVIKQDGGKIAITGYTDKTGDTAKNQELAKNRAVAVRDALTASGTPVANIEMRPPLTVEIGASGTGDAEARRVEISRQ